ncbi:nitrite reductase small subunit NirD [Denitrificimonas caeni]|uniref:nitrite reductase small subunit NirD n=1 Tax=Denitrificimonas caeni TaxID=521720 RepID=UPI0019655E83|nr:nitrite reductase small subunit NirD [Denitrificimonas caeni]
MTEQQTWITVGQRSDLIDGAGVGAQVALFYLKKHNQLFAVGNLCPFNDLNIIARGIIGDIKGEPVVASPLHKEHFSLLDGHCLEQPEVRLPVWQVRLEGNVLQVMRPATQATSTSF